MLYHNRNFHRLVQRLKNGKKIITHAQAGGYVIGASVHLYIIYITEKPFTSK